MVSQVIGYPRYVTGSRRFMISNKLQDYNILTWRPPYYEFWSVEGGNRVIQCNNIGLYGEDVHLHPNSENMFLLGDSFIEAGQYDGRMISAGVLQKIINKQFPEYNVINLGSSGHDPYVLWYRTAFFEKWFKPDKVVLVYESFERLSSYFSRWSDQSELSYDYLSSCKELTQSVTKSTLDVIRGKSAYLNLMTTFRPKDPQNQDNSVVKVLGRSQTPLSAYAQLLKALDAFNKRYGDDFYFVSLMRDNPYQEELQEYCLSKRINYSYNGNIMIPSYLINGSGHLNISGNQELGSYLGHLILGNI